VQTITFAVTEFEGNMIWKPVWMKILLKLTGLPRTSTVMEVQFHSLIITLPLSQETSLGCVCELKVFQAAPLAL
jgi:hypothetical protein